MYLDIAAESEVDGVFAGVSRDVLSSAHGGDFGIFGELDADESGDVTLKEWGDYIDRSHFNTDSCHFNADSCHFNADSCHFDTD